MQYKIKKILFSVYNVVYLSNFNEMELMNISIIR